MENSELKKILEIIRTPYKNSITKAHQLIEVIWGQPEEERPKLLEFLLKYWATPEQHQEPDESAAPFSAQDLKDQPFGPARDVMKEGFPAATAAEHLYTVLSHQNEKARIASLVYVLGEFTPYTDVWQKNKREGKLGFPANALPHSQI